MTAQSQREVESKFDVAPDFLMPDLTSLTRSGDTVEHDTVALVSTYFDTAELNLFGSRLTLRRRTGQADTGWHLKVPGDGFRTELRWPLTDQDGMPDELRALIRPFVAGNADVQPVVRLRVQRTRYRLLDSTGALRFEIADDQIRADGLSRAVVTPRWREVEVELGPSGRRKDLARAAELLQRFQAQPSVSTSKLSRALAGADLDPAAAASTAGAIVSGYLHRQHEALVAGHFAISMTPLTVAAGEQPGEEVHDMRVAIRRLRSTLRTFSKLFDPQQARQLDSELAWLAGELGAVRDCQVLKSRLHDAVEELPRYLVVGPVAERVQQVLGEELAGSTRQLISVRASADYARLFDRLARWRANPPVRDRARSPAGVLVEELAAAQARLTELLRQMRNQQAAETDLHRARRGAKRARYAGEALKAHFPREVEGLMRQAMAVQTVLGEYQDALVAANTLRHLADKATDAGEPTFTYGVLVADQRRAAADATKDAMQL